MTSDETDVWNRSLQAAAGIVWSVVAALLLFGLVVFVWTRSDLGPDWLPGRDPSGPQVLVFVVSSPRDVAVVRDAVDPARVVASDRDVLALVEGRVVATSADAASRALTRVGWVGREVEVMSIPRRRAPRPDRSPAARDDATSSIAELVNRPTLSLGEAARVLESLRQGS